MAISVAEFNELMRKANEEPTYTKAKKHHGDPEHELQVRCVKWFRYIYPKHVILAIPNAARRSERMGAYMKAEGMLTGCPDLLIPEARQGYNCLWIEMKNGKKGRLSEHQKAVHPQLEAVGNLVKVCRTEQEFQDTVNNYLQ